MNNSECGFCQDCNNHQHSGNVCDNCGSERLDAGSEYRWDDIEWLDEDVPVQNPREENE